jgi:hypothetical protein
VLRQGYKPSQWLLNLSGIHNGIVDLVVAKMLDPYAQLLPLFQDISAHDAQLLFEDTELSNGGAALTAYAKLQFTEMTDYEREALMQGLLKYCELDTLAMVMIYEAWREWC